MKKILAIAVATAISAPAMADLTIGGSTEFNLKSENSTTTHDVETNVQFTASTTADIFNYVLTGSQNRIKALNVINDTDNIFMEYRPATWFDDKYLNQDPVSGSPEYYTYNGVDSSGDSQIDVYPKPDGVYTIRFNCIFRNDDLSADVDTLLIPSMPVIHLAIALLARERGETGGTSAPEYFGIADKYLSDAIALDAQKHPDETIWYTP